MSFKNALASLTIAASLLTLGSPAHAGLDFLESSTLSQKIHKEVAKRSIGANVNLVDADIYDGISMGLKYRIQSEPSYVDGYYTRLDKYTFDVNIKPGDIIEGLETPIGFAINKGAEVIFARQFKSQKESLTALPYTLKQIPLTAKSAVSELNVGDFVSLQTKLSFVVSLGASTPLGAQFTASGSTHAYVSGDFYVHLFKMADNRIRVKLIGIRGRGAGVNAQVSMGSLQVFGFSYLNRKLERWVNLTPLAFNANKTNSDVFMVDYVFNLNNAEAAAAYENLMVRRARFKDLQLISPLDSTHDLKEKLLTDLTDVESLSYRDRNQAPQDRRVDRIFKGANSSVGRSHSFSFGLNLFRVQNGKAFAQNKVAQTDRNEEDKKYLLDTFSVNKKIKLLFGLFGDETTISTNLLFSSDDQWNPVDFIGLTMSREIRMKDVTRNDYKKIQDHVRRLIPAQEYAKINWKPWDFSDGKRVNGYFSNRIFFRTESLAAMPNLSYQNAYALLKSYVERTGQPSAAPYNTSMVGDNKGRQTWMEKYEADFQYLARYISVVFASGYDPEVRHQNFLLMKDYPLWQERGVGFMLSLIPKAELSKVISYEMTFSAKGVDTISAKFGNFSEEELYNSLMYIQSVINNRSFDLRLYTDETGEFKNTPR